MTRLPWWFWTTTAFLIVGGALFLSTPADAQPGIEPKVTSYAMTAGPDMCSVLDDHPTLAGVQSVLQGIEERTGFTPFQAGEALWLGVAYHCPHHTRLLTRYSATWLPAGELA